MYKKIEISRLSAGSVYELLAIGSFCSIVPFCTLMGLFALFRPVGIVAASVGKAMPSLRRVQ